MPAFARLGFTFVLGDLSDIGIRNIAQEEQIRKGYLEAFILQMLMLDKYETCISINDSFLAP